MNDYSRHCQIMDWKIYLKTAYLFTALTESGIEACSGGAVRLELTGAVGTIERTTSTLLVTGMF